MGFGARPLFHPCIFLIHPHCSTCQGFVPIIAGYCSWYGWAHVVIHPSSTHGHVGSFTASRLLCDICVQAFGWVYVVTSRAHTQGRIAGLYSNGFPVFQSTVPFCLPTSSFRVFHGVMPPPRCKKAAARGGSRPPCTSGQTLGGRRFKGAQDSL